MSHPKHELSPSDHGLSQDVLEFLIAHQDWFMLDTPPPPALPPTPSRSLTPPLTPHSAGITVSDDEGPEGWRIIERHHRLPSDRTRTFAGSSTPQTTAGTSKGERGRERTQMGIPQPGIVRSRTVPSTRKTRPNTAALVASPALLRKARRASAQPA
jgi:GTPase-activating protein SAC7